MCLHIVTDITSGAFHFSDIVFASYVINVMLVTILMHTIKYFLVVDPISLAN